MKRLFTQPGVWSGCFYEMKLLLGKPSETPIEEVLRAIWGSRYLEGPFPLRDTEPWEQQRIGGALEINGHLYGTARVGRDSGVIPCGTFSVREEDANGMPIADFTSVYIPLGGLGAVFPVGVYPFGDHSAAEEWRPQVDEWFLTLLNSLRGRIHFEIGAIGWEPELAAENLENAKSAAASTDRFDGFVLPSPDGNLWYPPTRFDIVTL
jgi:hypothetical protein